MKYENVKKQLRVNWATAPAPNTIWVQPAHVWCTLQPSKGRFYRHYTNTRWWFEFEQDALFFALKWGGR
jgi:hypothetical protein